MKYRLEDLINIPQFQALQDKLNEIYSFPSAIIDNDGNILTATAWQDICTKFHRQHPECEKMCIQSDKYIIEHLGEANPAVSYKCPHGLVDNATPIIIDGVHYGNFFTGQFFLESPNLDFFKDQAVKYGFDQNSYMDAVQRVPVWSQEQLKSYLYVIKGLIEMISSVGVKSLKEIESRKELEDSEAKFRNFFENSADGKAITALDGKLIEVNEAFCRMIGYSKDEILNKSFNNITHPDDRQKGLDLILLGIQGRKGQLRFEKRYLHKDGREIWVEIISQIQKDSEGNPLYLITSVINITERKNAEQDLKKNEALLKSVMDNTPDAIMQVDSNGVITYINKTVPGLSVDEVIGTSIYSWVPEEHKKVVKKAFDNAFNFGLSSEYESIGASPDDKPRTYFVRVNPVIVDGKTIRAVYSATDITQRKQIEDDLQESRTSLQTILHSTADGILAVGKDNKILFYNARFLDLWRIPYSVIGIKDDLELLNYVVDQLVDPDSFIKKVKELYNSEKEHNDSITFKDGRIFERFSGPMKNGSEVTGRLWSFKDITLTKKSEIALAASERKFSTAFHGSPGIFAISSFSDGRFIDVNESFLKFAGYTRDEVIGHTVYELDIWAGKEQGERLREILTKDGSIKNFESVYRKKNGEIGYGLISASVIEIDGEKCLLTETIDITERKLFEEQLKESETKLRSIFENSIDAIGVSKNGYHIMVNQAYMKLFGFNDQNEIKGKSILNFIAPECHEQVIRNVENRSNRKPVPSFYEIIGLRKDNSRFDMEVHVSSFELNGEVLTLAILRDISGRKKSEQAIRDSEEKYRNLFNNAEVGMFITRLDGSEILEFNDKYLKILGYTTDEIKGKPSKDMWADKSQRALMVEKLKANSFVNNFECDLKNKEGKIRKCITSLKLYSETGILEGSILDITERKQAEELLKNQKKDLTALFQISQTLAATLDLSVVLQTIIDSATELIELESGAIYLAKGNELYLEATKPPLPPELPDIFRKASIDDHPHIKKAILTGLPVVLPDTQSAELSVAERVIVQTRNLRSIIYVPIFIEKRRIGILIVGTKGDKVKEFTENEISLYRTFSTQAALAIENARLMKSTQNAESYFRALIENGSDLIALVDVTGEIKYESPSVTTLLGYEPAELKNKCIYDYLHVEDKRHLIEFLQNDLYKKMPVQKIECRFRHKNNSWRIFEVTGNNLLSDPIVNAIVLNCRDITDRKEAELELQMLKQSIDTASEGAYWMDIEGNFIYVNDSGCKILGYTRDELLKMKVSDVNPSATPERWQAVMENIKQNKSISIESIHKKKDGTLFPVELSSTYFKFGGKEYCNGFAKNITERKEAEFALKISQERFEQVANSSGIWIWEVDVNGLYTYVSPMEETILGYKVEEVVGKKHFYDFFAPEIKEELKKKAFEVFAEKGNLLNLENANLHQDGHIVILETSGIPILDEMGNLLGYRGADRDITLQKFAIEKLRDSEDQFRTLVENSPNMIVRFDENLRHIFVNRAVEETAGKPAQFFYGKSHRELGSMPLEQIEFSESILKSVFDSKKPVSFETGLTGPKGKVQLVSKAVPEFDESGNVKSVLVIHHDITDRVKAESAKEAAESKYKTMFSEMNNGCALHEIIIDDKGKCIDYVTIEVNTQFEKLLGVKREDVVGKKASDILPEAELEKWTSIFGPVAQKGESTNYEMYSPINMKYFEGVAYSPSKNLFAVVFSDVTSRKKIEADLEKHHNNLEELVKERTRQLDALNTTLIYEIERKNEAERLLKESLEKEKELNTLKSRFINTASHEFKTPLTSVLSSVELMQRYGHRWPEEKKAVHLDRIKISVEYLNGLINDVLYVSRAESGKISLNPVPTNLNDLCNRVIEEARLYGTEKHEYVFKPLKEEKDFNLDPKQMYIILQNLISNATKYSPEGGKIELKTGFDSKKIKISVKDQGIGIPEEELPKLFEPFHRVETVRDVSGTGLGLVIVKNAVDMHNGNISVKSQPGKGSTFSIEIPLI